MSPRLRKIIALIFVAVFAAAAPLLVLYTAGYRYHWKKGRFEKTGILTIGTQPAGAAVFLNGVGQKKTSPASFYKLLPDDYLVRLHKSGYLPWQKTLEVKSGETVFAKDVVLFRDALPRLLLKGALAAAASDGRIAAVADSDGWRELLLMSGSGAAPAVLARFSQDAFEGAALSWSPDGSYLVLTASKNGEPLVFIYSAGRAAEPAAVHELLRDYIESGAAGSGQRAAGSGLGRLDVRWSAYGSALVATTDKGVFLVRPDTAAVEPLLASAGVLDAAVVGGRAYVLAVSAAGSGQRAAGSGEAGVVLDELLLSDPAGRKTLASLPVGRYRFEYADAAKLLVSDEGGGRLLLFDAGNGEQTAAFEGKRAVWEKNGGGRLLVWNDLEISVLDPADGSKKLVTRIGTPIGLAAWHPGGGCVFYSTPTSIAAIELDDRDGRNAYDLVKFTGIGGFFLDAAGGKILFAGTAGKQEGLYEREL